jgi:hypothetical protein
MIERRWPLCDVPSARYSRFDAQAFLDSIGVSRRVVRFPPAAMVFAQGAQANSVNGGLKINSSLMSIVLHD